MIKEIPILFSTPMVKAILEGRKTQTRRLLKCKRIPVEDIASVHPDGAGAGWIAWIGRAVSAEETRVVYPGDHGFKCPYGKAGDLLWVRESWQLKGWDFEEGTMTVKFKTGETHKCLAHDPDEDSSWLMDKVDQLENRGYIKPDPSNEEMFVFTDKAQPFHPSIHMPKEAARIWLRVENVRIERLQDITGDDVLAEGVGEKHRSGAKSMTTAGIDYRRWQADQKLKFQKLWVKINGADTWQANPWVWVVQFSVLSTTGKPDLKTT
jgi:hypothetical protein